jgi:hypothetical protein
MVALFAPDPVDPVARCRAEVATTWDLAVTMRFTLDGTDAIEGRIARDMDVIRDAALEAVGEESLRALILGGGYGRGEGGVYVVDGEERVYNDYDLFVVVPFTSRKRRNWVSSQLAGVKAAVEPGCGIHVDFGPPMPESDLASQPYELMFMELKAGHHVLHGPEQILDGLPEYDESSPPLDEGARLFMNRGVGLLMAEMLLREGRELTQEEHEFSVRNMYKAMMAMGDGVLFVQQNYDPSYVVRQERVQSTPALDVEWWGAMQAAYANALAFKFRPTHELPDGRTLEQWYNEILSLFLATFLWFERQRLNSPTMNWNRYQELVSRLPDLSQRSRLKNVYRNFRHESGTFPPLSECVLHPRDRILKRLPGLLQEGGATPKEEASVLRFWESFG